jgi:hypothetical protein
MQSMQQFEKQETEIAQGGFDQNPNTDQDILQDTIHNMGQDKTQSFTLRPQKQLLNFNPLLHFNS